MMALFMDIHTLDGPVSAEQAAGAHRADLDTQGRYGVDYRQYWVDEEHGRIFCLVEAASSPTRSFRSPKAAEPARQLARAKVDHARPHHRGRA
jgi:Nickel responsive protein SCO4226-like